jgi:hemolysin activation/secretion protein
MSWGQATTGWWRWAAAAAAALLMPCAALAADLQSPVDRSDPSVIAEEEERRAEPPRPPPGEAPAAPRAGEPDTMASFQPFVAGAIRVEGATMLSPSRFAPAIEPYLGRPLGADDLRALARDVADVARGAGYGLATAWVPPQSVGNGVLRVRIDEGRIDAVEASGPAADAVERLLGSLAGGAPVRTAALERQLLIAGDLAGVSLGRPRLLRSDGRNLLRIETRRERVEARAGIDNWGTAAVGPVRARLSIDIAGVIGFGDRLTVGGMVTPLQPREFQLIQVGYSTPVGTSGTQVSVRASYSHSAAGGSLRDRDLAGNGFEVAAGVSHPIVRSRDKSLWAQALFGFRDSDLSRSGSAIRADRIVSLSGVLHGSARLGGGTGRARLSLVQGLDLLGATDRGAPLASRADAGGTFTRLGGWADFTRPLGSDFSLRLAAEGQLATRPLLASEEMGLGGREFLRGFDYREFAGDRGVAGSIELRLDLDGMFRPLRRAQPYLFADAGHVGNLDGGAGGGSLASAGGGLRVWMPHRLEAGIELGIPLTDGALDRRPEPRFSFSVGSRF